MEHIDITQELEQRPTITVAGREIHLPRSRISIRSREELIRAREVTLEERNSELEEHKFIIF